MARRAALTLAHARRLASDVVRDDDAHVDELIELFARTAARKTPEQQALRMEILRTWYDKTEHCRNAFRDYLQQFEEIEEADEDVETDAIESNAAAS